MAFLGDMTGEWSGTCGFRLMPTDDLAPGAATAVTASEADGHGWSLRYTWTHPDDGVQAGTLLLGSPDDAGSVSGGWVDSWHQKPEMRLLTGTWDGSTVQLEMEYSGWGWTIEVTPQDDALVLQMHNVIPDGVEGAEPGPYLVMDARLLRSA